MRRKWTSEIQTIAVALVVTLLIWLWAEGQNVSRRPLSVQVLLPELAGNDLLLQSRDGDGQTLEATARLVFEGSSASLDRAEDLRGSVLQIAPRSAGLPTVPGASQVINLVTALRAHPDVAKLSATLTSVEPETIVVSATRLASRELPVRVELARSIALDGEPRPSMNRVRVRVPEAQIGRLNDDAFAVAVVSEDQILGLRGEGIESVKATIRLPAAMGEFDAVRFQPDTIDVTLRARQALESVRLPANVPVWVALPPTERTERWEVEVLDKFLSDVSVSGPPEQVARLGRPGVVVKALVEIGSDDLIRAAEAAAASAAGASGGGAAATNGALVVSRAVVFTGLPSDVTPVGQVPQVRVRISPSAAAASSPSGGGAPAPAPSGSTPATTPSTTPAAPTGGSGNGNGSRQRPSASEPTVPPGSEVAPLPGDWGEPDHDPID